MRGNGRLAASLAAVLVALLAAPAAAALQFSEFLKLGGAFTDTCGGAPCRAAGWTGP